VKFYQLIRLLQLQIESYTKELEKARIELGIEKYIKYFAKFVSGLSKIKTCPHCEAKQEDVKLDKSSVFVFTEGDKKRLLTTEIRFRFENMVSLLKDLVK
jgi:hypothetical protein